MMLLKPTSIALLMLTSAANVQAENKHRHHDAHVHGHAELTLAVSANTILLEFDSPAINLLGFEHAPSSAEEHKLIEEAANFLRTPSRWIRLVGGHDCMPTEKEIDSHLLHSDTHKAHGDEEHRHQQHADFTVSIGFQCQDADPLEQVDLSGLFQRFPGFDEIKVQWLTDRLQSATELHAENPVITLR